MKQQIKSKEQYIEALKRLEQLMNTKNKEEQKELLKLADLIEEYEKQHYPIN